MLYTYPHYYRKFQCVASECEDTCCAGWEIMIDDKALEKYKKVLDRWKYSWYHNEVCRTMRFKFCKTDTVIGE